MNTDSLVDTSRARRRLPEPAMRRLLRERARLTQDEIARVAGVDRATISRWETGSREPRGELLTRYLEILDRLTAA